MDRARRTVWLLVALLTLAAAAVRLPALAHDAWLDEVWSWGLTLGRSGAWDALTHPSSSNHPLNTLWFHLLGDQDAFWLYRLPAYAAGLASIPLAAALLAPRGALAQVLGAALFAGSYLLGVYGTEARGYALEVLFALVAFWSAPRWVERGSRPALALAWSAGVLGFLSQYLFVHAWGALGLWSLARVAAARGQRGRELRRAALLHAVPAAFLVAWWSLVLRRLFNAGTPPWELGEVLDQTAGWTLGLPLGTPWMLLGLLAVAVVLAVELRARRAGGEWALWLGGIVVLPAATMLALRDQYVCPRYLLVPIALLLLLAACALARLAQGARWRLPLALVLLGAVLAGNAVRLAQFLSEGRGGYRAALLHMAARTAGPDLQVTSNQALDVLATLDYHQRILPRGRRVLFHAKGRLPPGGVEWLIWEEVLLPATPRPRIAAGPHAYALDAVFRHSGPAGSDWALYRRVR